MNATAYPEVGWMKERFQVLTLNDDICELDFTMQPGGKVPVHLHKESDEYFKILEGELTFTVDGKTTVARPGEDLTVPRMVKHGISNKSGGVVKCRVSYKPVADQGKFFQILFFLHGLNPDDKNAVFKAMYIAHRLNYREFSTMEGGMKVAENLMMGFFKLIAPLTGWNGLVGQYTQMQVGPASGLAS